MFHQPHYRTGSLEINTSSPGELLEIKIEKLMHAKEPLSDGATPLIYTPRAEGIRASTNIRTDRFEIAVEATDKIAKSYMARREERAKASQKPKEPEKPTNEPTPEPKPEPKP